MVSVALQETQNLTLWLKDPEDLHQNQLQDHQNHLSIEPQRGSEGRISEISGPPGKAKKKSNRLNFPTYPQKNCQNEVQYHSFVVAKDGASPQES